MKINKIYITNFRSIKDTQTIDNIGDTLIFTGINNSGKSSFLNAICIFFGEKSITETDFHKGKNKVTISILFSEVDDEYLEKFSEFKLTKVELRAIKREEEVFESFEKEEVKNKSDLGTDEQIEFVKNRWLQKFKEKYGIQDGELLVEYSVIKEKLKGEYLNKKGVEIIFPQVVFIDDERNFGNEENGGTGSITKKFFENQEITSEESSMGDIYNKDVSSLSITDLEQLLKEKGRNVTQTMEKSISDNFGNYYDSSYKIQIKPDTSIAHKNFSLNTLIDVPGIGEVPLSKVGAGLRALYILALLKAYYENIVNRNIIFIIEEPELYLHPKLQKEIAIILQNISKEQQVFFTTHSPLLLNNFDINSIKEIRKSSTFSEVNDSELSGILENLGFSLLDIIKYKYIIFVEGRDDMNILKKLIQKFYPTKKDEVEIITSNSCGNLAYYASLKFLGLINTDNIKYLILRDRDNKSDKKLIEDFKKQLESKDIKEEYIDLYLDNFKILDRYSIENFFGDLEKLKSIKGGFDLEDFISTFDTIESGRRKKESLKIGKESDFKQQMVNLKSDYENTYVTIRGHNFFDALVCYLNNGEKKYMHDKVKRGDFIDCYIKLCKLEDFTVLKHYLDQLFL